jgi:4,5-DOPA dioxygenase extradiol
MNALGGTPFAEFLTSWGRSLPRPAAILVVSAHWESRRLSVATTTTPETIHDFYGFPESLYALRYPAPGAPAAAERARDLLAEAGFDVTTDPRRGLDHGAWAPLRFVFPEADTPVFQVSLLSGVPLDRLVDVGRALAPLRDEDVLIIGSGNLVHNLRTADFDYRDRPPEPWVVEFDAWVKERLDAGNVTGLTRFRDLAPHGSLAHPTVEHYAPLLVACGASGPQPSATYPFEGFEHATISMRCVQFE